MVPTSDSRIEVKIIQGTFINSQELLRKFDVEGERAELSHPGASISLWAVGWWFGMGSGVDGEGGKTPTKG